MRKLTLALTVAALSLVAGPFGCTTDGPDQQTNGEETDAMTDTGDDLDDAGTDTTGGDDADDGTDAGPEAPNIRTFETASSDYAVGDTIDLEWTLEGGEPDSVTLEPDVGDVTGQTSAQITVSGDTTYTLTAANAAGEDEATLTLMPNAAGPSIDQFEANPSTVGVGESVTFNWDVSTSGDATIECALDVEDDGTDDYNIADCENQTTQTHTYVSSGSKTAKLTASTPNGDVSETVSVTVNGSALKVKNTNDSGSGSLRGVVANASSGDLVRFDLSSYPATIQLQSAVEFDKDLTIRAPSRGDVILDGQGQNRIFDIQNQHDVTLQNLEMANGLAKREQYGTMNGQPLYEGTNGGLVRGEGTLTIENSTLRDSTSLHQPGGSGSTYRGDGGCLGWVGDATIAKSTFRNCEAQAGGAMYLDDTVATIRESSIVGNTSPDSNAGGFFVDGTVDLVRSTVRGNQARGDLNQGSYGGGFYILNGSSIQGPRGDQSSLFLNSTIHDNAATANGGAGIVEAPLNVVFSTVTGNRADDSIVGGGVNSDNEAGAFWQRSDELLIRHSIVSGNSADSYDDIKAKSSATVVAEGATFVGNPDTGNQTLSNVDTQSPQLGSLGQNGGPTQTRKPQSGSPVIDAVGSGMCTDTGGTTVTDDQRSSARPAQSTCDAGSVEVQ